MINLCGWCWESKWRRWHENIYSKKTKQNCRIGEHIVVCATKKCSYQEDLLYFQDCSFLMMSTFTRISWSNLIDLLLETMTFSSAFFVTQPNQGGILISSGFSYYNCIFGATNIFYFVFSNHTKNLFTESYLPDYKSRAVSPLWQDAPPCPTYFASLWYKIKIISVSSEVDKRREICAGQAVRKLSEQLLRPWRDS